MLKICYKYAAKIFNGCFTILWIPGVMGLTLTGLLIFVESEKYWKSYQTHFQNFEDLIDIVLISSHLH